MTRILIIGRSGQVAQALNLRARHHDADVMLLSRQEADLGEPDRLHAVVAAHAADVVVNAAAYTAVDKAESEPGLAHRINATGAAALAAACDACGLPFIHLSTDYVFDGRKGAPYAESDPTGPINVYGTSKCAGEEGVRAATDRHVTLRTAWVHSPYGANFVKTMLRLAETRDEVSVVADQTGSPTSALDLADAIHLIAHRIAQGAPSGGTGTFHVAGGGAATWADVAARVFAASRKAGGPSARVKPITTLEYPTAAARPATSLLDCAKLHAVYGVRLRPWEPAVDDTVAALIAGGPPV